MQKQRGFSCIITAVDEETLKEKYGLIIIDGEHYYIQPLDRRTDDLKFATPCAFTVYNHEIRETAWKNLLPAIAEYFLCIEYKKKAELLAFKREWTSTPLFVAEERPSYCRLQNGIYMSYNQPATKSVWTIMALMEFFKIPAEKCELIIFRPSGAEYEEVNEYYSEKAMTAFRIFMKKMFEMDDSRINKIIFNINVISNKYMPHISAAYSNLFLFYDYNYFVGYSRKLLNLMADANLSNDHKYAIERYVMYLDEFYKIYLT